MIPVGVDFSVIIIVDFTATGTLILVGIPP